MKSFLMNQLHEQKFTRLENVLSDVVRTHLHSCVGPIVRDSLLTHLNTPSFHLFSAHFFYSTLYSYRYTTFYSYASFTMLVWSYYWWLGYPFVKLHVWEWVHYNPWYISRYHCNYHIEEWNSHTKRGFSPFSLPHIKTNGYCHHYRWFSNLGKCCHYRYDLYKFGATCFDDDNTCSNNCRSRQYTILHKINVRKWFHSPCHRDLQLFPSSFLFLFVLLCTCQYSLPSTYLLGTFDVYILL